MRFVPLSRSSAVRPSLATNYVIHTPAWPPRSSSLSGRSRYLHSHHAPLYFLPSFLPPFVRSFLPSLFTFLFLPFLFPSLFTSFLPSFPPFFLSSFFFSSLLSSMPSTLHLPRLSRYTKSPFLRPPIITGDYFNLFVFASLVNFPVI